MPDLNIEDLYKTYTTDEQIKESFDRFTASTGRYQFAATKAEKVLGADDHVIESLRGRPHARLFGRMTHVVDGVDKKAGSVGADVSWETRKDAKGKPDKASKLWGQLVVALGMKDKSVGEVLDAVAQYPISVYVNESFKVPATAEERAKTGRDSVYKTARDAEARKEYRSQGYEARNFIESISKL